MSPAPDDPRFALPGPLTHAARSDSPAVGESDPGVRIAVADVARDGALTRFTLLVTCGLPDVDFHSFADLARAVAVELQDAGAGEGAAFPLVDPTVNELDPPVRNFTPPAEGAAGVAFLRAYVAVPVEAVIAPGPGLFVRASLQRWRSNTAHVAAEAP